MITNGRHRRPSSEPVLTWMERVASTGWQRLIAPLMTPIMGLVVALVPPLCSAGILLYFGKRNFVWNAILLFLTNASALTHDHRSLTLPRLAGESKKKFSHIGVDKQSARWQDRA